jgi:hypothetical protein
MMRLLVNEGWDRATPSVRRSAAATILQADWRVFFRKVSKNFRTVAPTRNLILIAWTILSTPSHRQARGDSGQFQSPDRAVREQGLHLA